ncbi:hypothetical protein DIURU_002966 [Diutina rugosa]|uniref:Autophagy-related protein 2 n=1 Tax=Diutina rugosa TaxID=5481 RepID=A0A642UN72_DIURU|nr:uncharacterized protein DIURU_002966 [Diutina rugosa]KAA8902172.1 hypothetical protein DIURU_002966 [Diutina rugosa]
MNLLIMFSDFCRHRYLSDRHSFVRTTDRATFPTSTIDTASNMVGGWLPNLQKRMLLYVLQQLALFSDIDMPNLTQVSLNGIVLNQITVDADKVMARFAKQSVFHLRSGIVGEFSVKPVGAGISIDASNVDLVVAISLGELPKNPEELEASIAESISEMLAQSSAELVRVLEDESDSDIDENAQPQGALGGVVARAVEMALARLQIDIKDLRCKLVFSADIDDVIATVSRVSYSTTDSVKHIEVEGVKILSEITQSSSSPSSSVSSSESDPSMMHSTMFMSAVSAPTSGSPHATSLGTASASYPHTSASKTPTIEVSRIKFEIPPLVPASIEIDDVRLCLSQVCTSMTQFCTAYTHHLKFRELKRKRDINQRAYEYPPRHAQYVVDDTTKDDSPPLFEVGSLKIASAVVSSNSPDPLELRFTNVYIKQRQDVMYGGIETVDMGIAGANWEPVFSFDQDSERRKADVRFESSAQSGATTYIAKPARLTLTADVVKQLMSVLQSTVSVTRALTQLNLAMERDSHQCELEEEPLRFVFQSAEIFVTFGNAGPLLQLAPIHYNSAKNQLRMASAQVSLAGTTVLSLGPLTLDTAVREFVGDRKRKYHTDLSVVIDQIDANIDYGALEVFYELLSWFKVDDVSSPSTTSSSNAPTHSRFAPKSTTADWRLVVKSIKGEVRAIPSFETIKGKSMAWLIYSLKGEIIAQVNTIDVRRFSDNDEEYEVLLSRLWPQKSEVMFTAIQRANRIDISISGALASYHTYWLTLNSTERSQKREQDSSITEDSNATIKQSESESKFRINAVDCALGLHPGRIASHAYIHWEKAVIDMMVGANSYTKGSVNSIGVWVIDDLIHAPKELISFEKSRYLRLLNITMLHFAVTHPPQGLDMKINVDKVTSECCADSWQVMISLFGDLSVPTTFTDNQLTRVELEQPINLWDDLETLEPNDQSEVTDLDEDMSMSMSLVNIQENYVPVTSHTPLPPSFRLHVNISEIKLYLYDGYDWSDTRQSIKQRVKKMEQQKTRRSEPPEATTKKKEDSPIVDTLFSSIHMTMSDPEEFTQTVNSQIHGSKDPDDNLVHVGISDHYEGLELHRSKTHKVQVVAKGVEVIVELYEDTPQRPTASKLEVLVDDVSVYDNLNTSSWTKAVGYLHSRGLRELGTHLVRVQMTTVRADPRLEGSAEGFLSVSVLPLRLHLDQDTVSFASRFFTFANPKFDLPDAQVFFSKVFISALDLKVDYKPKPSSSGLTNPESLLGMFVVDGSKIKLQPVTVYGVALDRVGEALAMRGWLPQLQRNYQAIFGLLLGVGPVKSLVNIGGGFKDLVVVPYMAYSKDQSLLSGLRRGATKFARRTGGELFSLGAKLAVGTQNLLIQAETQFQLSDIPGEDEDLMYFSTQTPIVEPPKSEVTEEDMGFFDVSEVLSPKSSIMASSQVLSQRYKSNNRQVPTKQYSYDELDDIYDPDDLMHKSLVLLGPVEAKGVNAAGKKVSLYSNQPETVEEGIHAAYKALGTNLSATKRVLLRLKGDLGESETMQEALITVIRSSPLVLIRPIIGTTEAVGKTLMGLGNAIDPDRVKEAREKYDNPQ